MEREIISIVYTKNGKPTNIHTYKLQCAWPPVPQRFEWKK